MKAIKKLNKCILEDLEHSRGTTFNISNQLEKRIEYIAYFWAKTFGFKIKEFWPPDNIEDVVDSKSIDIFQLEFYIDEFNDCFILDINNKKIGGYFDQLVLPRRWLFEDFEKEVTEGKKKYNLMLKEKEAKFAVKNKKANEAKDKLVKSAISKLTKAELNALTGK